MAEMDGFLWTVTAVGGLAMLIALVRGVNQTGLALAQVLVEDRRRSAQLLRDDDAQAEAVGQAAGLEPLLLNSDGSIAEPIVGIVESR
jgi:heme exporter protein D